MHEVARNEAMEGSNPKGWMCCIFDVTHENFWILITIYIYIYLYIYLYIYFYTYIYEYIPYTKYINEMSVQNTSTSLLNAFHKSH